MKIVAGKTFYNILEAAKYIGRADTYIYKHGELRAKTTVIGRRRYIEKRHLDAFLQREEDDRIFCIDMTLFADFLVEKIGKERFMAPFLTHQRDAIKNLMKNCLFTMKYARLIHEEFYPVHGNEFERWMRGEVYCEA